MSLPVWLCSRRTGRWAPPGWRKGGEEGRKTAPIRRARSSFSFSLPSLCFCPRDSVFLASSSSSVCLVPHFYRFIYCYVFVFRRLSWVLLLVVSGFCFSFLPPPPPRHCRDARVYGHTTTATHEIEYLSPIEYTPPPHRHLKPVYLPHLACS